MAKFTEVTAPMPKGSALWIAIFVERAAVLLFFHETIEYECGKYT
jgi:hypothetical protein